MEKKPDKIELWQDAKLIVGALKAMKHTDTSNFGTPDWAGLEEDWFDWLKELAERYESPLQSENERLLSALKETLDYVYGADPELYEKLKQLINDSGER